MGNASRVRLKQLTGHIWPAERSFSMPSLFPADRIASKTLTVDRLVDEYSDALCSTDVFAKLFCCPVRFSENNAPYAKLEQIVIDAVMHESE